MVKADVLELLQNTELKYKEMSKGEANLYKSQISRWYVNGFTNLFYVAERETSHSTSDSLKEETIIPKEGENNSPEK